MPVRVNQRAVEARERKAAAAAAKAAAAEQEAERKKWEDNDKLVSRKLDRKVRACVESVDPICSSLMKNFRLFLPLRGGESSRSIRDLSLFASGRDPSKSRGAYATKVGT